jgi:sigma-54-like protein
MPFTTGVEMMPELGMTATPALVAYATMLALPGAALEQAVTRELAENPALVQDEAEICGGCGLPADRPCPYCSQEFGRFQVLRRNGATGPSPGSVPAASIGWPDALLADLRPVPGQQRPAPAAPLLRVHIAGDPLAGDNS